MGCMVADTIHDYPTLKAHVLAHACKPAAILIEDTGTGTALIQELKR